VDLDLSETIKQLEEEMLAAANNLEFEKAALRRDQIRELKRAMEGVEPAPGARTTPTSRVSYRDAKPKSGAGRNARGKRRVSEPF